MKQTPRQRRIRAAAKELASDCITLAVYGHDSGHVSFGTDETNQYVFVVTDEKSARRECKSNRAALAARIVALVEALDADAAKAGVKP